MHENDEYRGDFSGGLTGTQRYVDNSSPEDRSAARMYVRIRCERGTALAILDTGAPWCIAPKIGPDASDNDPATTLTIRGAQVTGRLARGLLSLVADSGEDIDIDATFFVPDPYYIDLWNHPSFIGLGALASVYFGVDPRRSLLHFGPIG